MHPQLPREELREEGDKHSVHHKSGYPLASLGPLNASLASIQDSSVDPLGSRDHFPYALSCMSSGALTRFGLEVVIYLVVLPRPVGAALAHWSPN